MKVNLLLIPLVAFLWGCQDNVFKEGKDRIIKTPNATAPSPYPQDPPQTNFPGASFASEVKDTSFVVNWPASEEAKAYLIYNAEKGSRPKVVRAVEPPANCATIKGLRPGTEYITSVRTVDDRGLYDLNAKELEVVTNGSPSYKNAFSLSFKGETSAELAPGKDMLPEGLFTVSLWAKKSQSPKGEEDILTIHEGRGPGSALTIGVKRDVVFLRYRGSGKPQELAHEKPAGDGKWHHLAATYNGKYLAFYMDGHMVKKQVPDLPLFGTYPAYLGAYRPGARHFAGHIDEVSIWNTAMSSLKIRQIYNEGSAANLHEHPAAHRLVAWYRLGDDPDDSAVLLKDVIGNFDAKLFKALQEDFTQDTP